MATIANIIHFIGQHWLLSGAIAILLVLLLLNEVWLMRGIRYQLTPQEAIQMINHHQAVMVDMRDRSSFEAAHVVGSVHIPEEKFEKKLNLINSYKTKPVILMCAMGNVAPKSLQRLKAMGFEQVYYLAGGMLAWQKENLPLLHL